MQALFVHVPPQELVPLEKQVAFVLDLLRLLCGMLIGKEDEQVNGTEYLMWTSAYRCFSYAL